jgi:hypothetical protein
MINILTQSDTPPSQIGHIMAPGFDVLREHGWRLNDDTPLADGYERTWVQDPERPDYAIPQDTLIGDRLAQEHQARLVTFIPLIPKAVLFKQTLRKHFGDGAESNTEVTRDAVAGYFIGAALAVENLKDAIILDKLFSELADWTHDGTTWTIPWEVVP